MTVQRPSRKELCGWDKDNRDETGYLASGGNNRTLNVSVACHRGKSEVKDIISEIWILEAVVCKDQVQTTWGPNTPHWCWGVSHLETLINLREDKGSGRTLKLMTTKIALNQDDYLKWMKFQFSIIGRNRGSRYSEIKKFTFVCNCKLHSCYISPVNID